jgi:hypothetical protein
MVKHDWQVHQVRATAFPTERMDPTEASTLWEQLSGSAPDTDQFVRSQGLRRQVGLYDDGAILEVRLQPPRIDWQLTPQLQPGGSLPSLGTYESVIPLFASKVRKWLDGTPLTFLRLAFAPHLFTPVASRQEGYQHIADLVPSLRLQSNAEVSDLLFQINHPRPSKAVADLRLNAVQKWAVAAVQGFELAVGESSVAHPVSMDHFCQLEMDINTAPTSPPRTLDSDNVPSIFDELVSVADKIAARGERA